MCFGVSWCALSVPRPFRRKKGGLWNCLHPFVHPFVRSSARPFVRTKFCRCHNSATTGLVPLQIKFIGTILACRCATSCSFARWVLPCSQGGGPPMICFYLHGLTLIPAWINNDIHYKVWDEITYPFLNFSGIAAEVWE